MNSETLVSSAGGKRRWLGGVSTGWLISSVWVVNNKEVKDADRAMTWHNVRAISQYVGVESGTGKINFTFSREGTKAGLVVHVHCDWKTYLCLAAIDSRMIETCRIRKQEVKVIQLCHSQYLAGTRVLFTFVPSGRPNMFAKCWSELASGAEWPSCFEKWGLPGAKLWARWPWCQHERLILVNVEESLMSTQTTNNSYIAARLDSFFLRAL